MNHPKISVLTVCYNSFPFMEESILSVVNQTYDNIEYVIIDGGSTDGTLDLLNKYRDKISILVSEKDKGIYDAINKGLKLATGDFLIVLGTDDHFLSYHTLEKVAPKLESQDCVYYGNVYMEEFNLIHKRKFNKTKRAIWNICHQCIFYPQNVYKFYEYDLKYKLFADNEYNFRISEKFCFTYIEDTISYFSYGGKSAKRDDIAWNKDKKKYIIKYCGLIPYLISCFRNYIKKLSI